MKFLKNRLVIGCLCVIFAFVIGFLVVPKLTDRLNDKITIVVAASDIKKGEELSSSNLKTIQISKGDVPYAINQYYNNVSESNGQATDNRRLLVDNDNRPRNVFASMDMKANDVITDMKISNSSPYSDENLRTLEANKYAVSVTVKSLATGISGNVSCGDIVTVIVNSDGGTYAPEALLYMEVIGVFNSDGAEINSENKAKGIPSTVTFKANLYQAQMLSDCENNASIHLALICRGDEEKAENLLKMQEDYFKNNNLLFNGEWFYTKSEEGAPKS